MQKIEPKIPDKLLSPQKVKIQQVQEKKGCGCGKAKTTVVYANGYVSEQEKTAARRELKRKAVKNIKQRKIRF